MTALIPFVALLVFGEMIAIIYLATVVNNIETKLDTFIQLTHSITALIDGNNVIFNKLADCDERLNTSLTIVSRNFNEIVSQYHDTLEEIFDWTQSIDDNMAGMRADVQHVLEAVKTEDAEVEVTAYD